MPAMKGTGRPVLAPSAIPAEGGRYHYLPGFPVRAPNFPYHEFAPLNPDI